MQNYSFQISCLSKILDFPALMQYLSVQEQAQVSDVVPSIAEVTNFVLEEQDLSMSRSIFSSSRSSLISEETPEPELHTQQQQQQQDLSAGRKYPDIVV